MRKMGIVTLLFGLALMFCTFGVANADTVTLTFDTFPGIGFPVPDGYNGFHWDNFYYLDGVNDPNTGYHNGVVSTNNVAYNFSGGPASISGRLFQLVDGYVTAAWNDNLEINITGYLAGNPVISGDFLINTSGPTNFFATSPVTIDTLAFISSGGTHHDGWVGFGTEFALDNLTVNTVPEPTTMLLLGSGLIGLAGYGRKKLFKK